MYYFSVVTFNDNSPNQGYAEVILKIPDLKVTGGGLFSKKTPKNAQVKADINKE